MRVLILDDREDQLRFLKLMLLGAGINCIGCTSIHDAWHFLQSEDISVLIIDYHLSVVGAGAVDYNASEFIKRVRSNSKQRNLSIIVMTADRTYQPKINSLESGADYYLCKPILKDELIVCVRNMMSRKYGHGGNVISYGDILVKTLSMEFFVKGIKIDLTQREYQIVLSLALRSGDYVGKELILRDVYGEQSLLNSANNNKKSVTKIIDVWICKIREKICAALGYDRNDNRGTYILTSWGMGYKISGHHEGYSIAESNTDKINRSKENSTSLINVNVKHNEDGYYALDDDYSISENDTEKVKNIMNNDTSFINVNTKNQYIDSALDEKTK